MTRLRIPGIVCIVLALAGSSGLSAQTKPPATQAPKQMKLKPIDINTAPEEDFALVGIDRRHRKENRAGAAFPKQGRPGIQAAVDQRTV